ncbi:glycosyltransferase family 4 protein [Maribacter sp. ACAM166]|uniref:glycosyltransferase family 4 protein n=1 Tax=Maribacter sp. ACAM166 TaxID=2508996 RepID=UPI0010FDA3C5|nr:glycosyltransferase family 4 protein [Maribacter sp. ACAM166]TLP81793.1 glycosyltransferase family 4 protein [Maribacter sp. ACAM166]
MKILMFGWEYPPNITGGLATACHGLVQGLRKAGHDITFVIPKAEEEISTDRFRLISASNVVLPDRPDSNTTALLNRHLPHVGQRDFLKKETYQFSGAYGPNLLEEVHWLAVVAAKLAKDLEFDVIHAHDWLTYLAGMVAKEISGKPLVVHIHATEFDRSARINPQVYEIERQGMLTANKVMAVSNLTRTTIINKYKIAPGKVVTTYNGVLQKNSEPDVYPKTLEHKIVTFLGRITYQKGPEYFVDAAEKVLKKNKNVRFVMAGSGDLMQEMIQKVAVKRMSHRFHFTGYLKNREVDQMLSISDVFVMPSVSEPFGIAPLEAIRSDVPVIISRQSGVAEVLPNALLVDYWDTDQLAEAINGLLNYTSLSKTVKEFGSRTLEHLTWDHTAAKVAATYASVA